MGDTIGIVKIPINIDNLSSWDVTDKTNNDANATIGNEAIITSMIDIPFAPYSRNDRLSRIADWTLPADSNITSSGNFGGNFGAGRRYSKGLAVSSARAVDEEDAGWSFTAEKITSKKGSTGTKSAVAAFSSFDGASRGGAGGGRFSARHGGGGGNKRGGASGRRNAVGWGQRFADRQLQQRKRDPSIQISSEWRLLEEIEFSRLAKLQLDPDDPVELTTIGLDNALIYDSTFDKSINTKNEKNLSQDEIFLAASSHIVSQTAALEDDEILLKLAHEHNATIICSDATAACLMASQKSAVPWDLTLNMRSDGILVIDKRPESLVGGITVNENANDSTLEEPQANVLNVEATKINAILPRILSKASSKTSTKESYRYSKLDLGDENVVIIQSRVPCFTYTNSVSTTEDIPIPLIITPLVEHEKSPPSGIDWKNKMDSQRGAILAQEIRNNGAQLARSIFSALLMGAESMKLAYINKGGKNRLALLSIQEYEPYELATQMSLNIPNGFGIFRTIIDLIKKQASQNSRQYLVMRDPNKPLLRLYKIGKEDFDSTIDDLINPMANLSAASRNSITEDEDEDDENKTKH